VAWVPRRSRDQICMLGYVPHDWLFKHVSCVVLHSGAGTTAAQAPRQRALQPDVQPWSCPTLVTNLGKRSLGDMLRFLRHRVLPASQTHRPSEQPLEGSSGSVEQRVEMQKSGTICSVSSSMFRNDLLTESLVRWDAMIAQAGAGVAPIAYRRLLQGCREGLVNSAPR